MRLLFDENLSYRLTELLADDYPGSVHARTVGLSGQDDDAIWEYAQREGLVIVSKDSDFHQRSFLYGHPPKVVWLQVGNAPTSAIVGVLRHYRTELAAFEKDQDAAFLVLS